ncbi:nucleotide-diphospho-sugar transferase [Pyrrhoderma noxium]|uniref:Nucleotide-diphospho-sugar transferase n=1 Tax=Pyrrhoderma noxium TaxID=2282107 RepID=A0A286US93_9AGAM|nr:nucleotide-diphospho-sugar transferase [Pyrrhoderma noxium]
MGKGRGAFVTLLTKPSYLAGTLVVDYGLRKVNSKYPFVAMISLDLPQTCVDILKLRGIETVPIQRLTPKSMHNGIIKEERFRDTWCKLAIFQLVDYERVVLLDSDMLIRKNMDELIEMDLPGDWIAADHVCACNPRKFPHYPKDWTPENCAYSYAAYPPEVKEDSPRPYSLLNSGTVVLTPSEETYAALLEFLDTSPLVEGFLFPDQDLLATFFHGRWKPLSYIYNALKTLRIIHKDLWRDEDVKCVHYILSDKPWKHKPKNGGERDEHYEVNQWWWDEYNALGEGLLSSGIQENRDAWTYLESLVAK